MCATETKRIKRTKTEIHGYICMKNTHLNNSNNNNKITKRAKTSLNDEREREVRKYIQQEEKKRREEKRKTAPHKDRTNDEFHTRQIHQSDSSKREKLNETQMQN